MLGRRIPNARAVVQAYEWLNDPVNFSRAHPRARRRVKSAWKTYSQTNAIDVIGTQQRYGRKAIKDFRMYQVYRKALIRIYKEIERSEGKRNTTFGMEIPNWRRNSSANEEDFAKLTLQLFGMVAQYNSLLAKQVMPSEVDAFLACQLHASVYELAGKKILRMHHMLTGRRTQDIGSALNDLRTFGHGKILNRFNNHVRNGIFHGRYMLSQDSKGRPIIQGADVSYKKGIPRIRFFKERIDELRLDTVAIMLFLMACISVNAWSYVNLIEECFSKDP